MDSQFQAAVDQATEEVAAKRWQVIHTMMLQEIQRHESRIKDLETLLKVA